MRRGLRGTARKKRAALVLALTAVLMAGAGPKRDGELVLDADAPVIEAEIRGVTLRLRVDLDQRDVVELNPQAVARLGVRMQPGFDAVLGGIRLPGEQAGVVARIDGRRVPLIISTHGQACCAGVDGAVSPFELPYLRVRFVRAAAPPATARAHFAMTEGEAEGLLIDQAPVHVQLTLGHDRTVASRAAGVLLAERHGGRFAGPYGEAPGLFGVARPVRAVAFADPPTLIGFTLPTILVRTADFGGGLEMPEEREGEGDLVVSRRVAAQRAWPVVVLGREYLDGCTEIVFHALPLGLDLACDFARRPDG